MKTQYDLHEIVEHLRALGRRPPTPESRQEVEHYLFNKWQGLQVVAGQVLGTWGGPESVAVLREWLMRLYEKKSAWSGVRGTAAECLARCVTAADADWLLDLYFSFRTRYGGYELTPAIAALPLDVLVPRLERVLRQGNRESNVSVFRAIGYREDRLAALARVIARRHLFDEDTLQQIDRYRGWWEAHERNLTQALPPGGSRRYDRRR